MKTEWIVKIGHSEVVVAVATEEAEQFDRAFSGIITFWSEQKEVHKRFNKFCQRKSKHAISVSEFVSSYV